MGRRRNQTSSRRYGQLSGNDFRRHSISIQTIMETPAEQACLVSDLSLREGILRSGT